VEDLTLLHPFNSSKDRRKQVTLLVQKIKGFFEKEGGMLFFFEHTAESYAKNNLERQINRQLFQIEGLFKKHVTKN
jgi:hypothetical protein